MFQEIVHRPFSVLPDGRRVLQCHSRGDRRFTPFNCRVTAFGRSDSIENHYQRAKRFGSAAPADWREAKALKRSGARQTAWRIGPLERDVRTSVEGNGFRLDDLGIQFYVMLWYRYLRQNPGLLEVAAQFDEYEDPFRGNFPFCQADVIRKASREGVESLRPMFAELEELLSAASS